MTGLDLVEESEEIPTGGTNVHTKDDLGRHHFWFPHPHIWTWVHFFWNNSGSDRWECRQISEWFFVNKEPNFCPSTKCHPDYLVMTKCQWRHPLLRRSFSLRGKCWTKPCDSLVCFPKPTNSQFGTPPKGFFCWLNHLVPLPHHSVYRNKPIETEHDKSGRSRETLLFLKWQSELWTLWHQKLYRPGSYSLCLHFCFLVTTVILYLVCLMCHSLKPLWFNIIYQPTYFCT